MSIVDTENVQKLEIALRQLYGMYMYLRDHDMSSESNTSRLLQDKSHSYLASRLADELEELAEVQSGDHVHSGRQPDTILEGSQVSYWLLLLASTNNVPFNAFAPHLALFEGYNGGYNEAKVLELRQECLDLFTVQDPVRVVKGLQLGFTFIGWACAEAGISPLAPAEFDLQQMQRKFPSPL